MSEQSTESLNSNTTDYIFDYDDEYSGCPSQHCNSTDPEFYNYKYFIDGITLFMVCIFGIIGTLMSVFVLCKPQLRNSFTNFLTALCMFDCSFLTMAIFYVALPSLSCW